MTKPTAVAARPNGRHQDQEINWRLWNMLELLKLYWCIKIKYKPTTFYMHIYLFTAILLDECVLCVCLIKSSMNLLCWQPTVYPLSKLSQKLCYWRREAWNLLFLNRSECWLLILSKWQALYSAPATCALSMKSVCRTRLEIPWGVCVYVYVCQNFIYRCPINTLST